MKRVASLLALVLALTTIIAPLPRNAEGFGFWQATSPVVIGDIVIGAKGETGIYGFKTSDGSQVWAYKTIDRVYTSPAIKDDKVYQVVSQDKYPYRFLTCLEAATGKLVWEVPVEKATYGKPMIFGDRILVGTTGFSANQGTLICFDMSGKRIWEWTKAEGWIVGNAAYTKDMFPNFPEGVLFVASYRGRVYTLDMRNGKPAQVWRSAYFETDGPGPNPNNPFKDGGPIECDLAQTNGSLTFGCYDGTIYRISAGGGTVMWRFYDKNVRWARSTPLVLEDKTFVGSNAVSDKGNGMYSFDNAGNNTGYFRTDTYVNSTPVSIGGDIVFGTDNGTLFRLTPSFDQVWKTQLNGFVSCKPAVSGDFIFVCTQNPSNNSQKTYCIRASNGSKIWEQ